ncbi:uncharacterized protein LOC105187223 isoform X3 [Harpegnathos saltator]|uniref:uncharacterized protein LOC105187223 isoform X3 n=1 Tax=Harpegnathos saltator TaxID=610380 RepID=UPI000DBED705|nr:uncharacterized protein LOC105187223 isoform X3 [Harpegnathos saltator]
MDQALTGWKRYVLVQPPVMLLLVAQSISGTILTDLIVYRTCTITLKINETECQILHNNSSSPEALKINLQVQPQASLILTIIFETYGYTGVFSIATILCVVATLYIILCVAETVQSHNIRAICKIFDFVLVKDLIRTCIKKRDGFNRSLVWSCIACLILLLITLQGEVTIGYLFASARLGWNIEKYSTYIGASVILGIFGTVSSIKLIRRYAGLPDPIIAIISVMSSLGGVLTYAFTWQSWHMYLSMSVSMFGNLSRPMIRAVLSKTVPVQDTGKVFSLTQSLETLLPFAAASLYTFLYSHYMPPIYPVPVWFLSAAFFILTIILLIYIQIQMIKHNGAYYVSLTDNSN